MQNESWGIDNVESASHQWDWVSGNVTFQAYQNRFSGSLPTSIGQWIKLEEFKVIFIWAQFAWKIPSIIAHAVCTTGQ